MPHGLTLSKGLALEPALERLFQNVAPGLVPNWRVALNSAFGFVELVLIVLLMVEWRAGRVHRPYVMLLVVFLLIHVTGDPKGPAHVVCGGANGKITKPAMKSDHRPHAPTPSPMAAFLRATGPFHTISRQMICLGSAFGVTAKA